MLVIRRFIDIPTLGFTVRRQVLILSLSFPFFYRRDVFALDILGVSWRDVVVLLLVPFRYDFISVSLFLSRLNFLDHLFGDFSHLFKHVRILLRQFLVKCINFGALRLGNCLLGIRNLLDVQLETEIGCLLGRCRLSFLGRCLVLELCW